MRSFLVFLAVIVAIGLVWLTLPILNQRNRDYETRLVAALQLVEDSITGSSADILRVDLFAPKIVPMAGDGLWQLTGIVSTQDRAGKSVNVRYSAVVSFTCQPYSDPACGKTTTLSIEGQPLVVDGAAVAELQDVLSATTESTLAPAAGDATAALPTDGATTSVLPAPQTDLPAATAEQPATAQPGAPAVAEVPAGTATTAPAAPAAPDSSAAPSSSPPSITSAAGTGPIQGDPLIFMTQRRLKQIGYDPGPVDGRVGPRTTTAIEDFQQRAGLPVDGQPSAALLEEMNRSAPAAAQ